MSNDALIRKVLEQDERLQRIEDHVITIEHGMITRDEFLTSHDQIVTMLQKLDQERVVLDHRTKRIEDRLSI